MNPLKGFRVRNVCLACAEKDKSVIVRSVKMIRGTKDLECAIKSPWLIFGIFHKGITRRDAVNKDFSGTVKVISREQRVSRLN